MPYRALANPNGLKVSKPGIDVRFADPFQLLFSSDFRAPQLVTKGQIGGGGGNQSETISTIGYKSMTPPPVVIANAMAPAGWRVTPFSGYGLANMWLTPVIEQPSFVATNVYDGTMRQRGGAGGSGQPAALPASFASIKFVPRINSSFTQFAVNNVNGVVIRYAVFEPFDG